MFKNFQYLNRIQSYFLKTATIRKSFQLRLDILNICLCLGRGKEMSLSRFLGVYYKLPKSDPNAVYLLPNAVYLLQCCFIAANIVWAEQCDNRLFPWKLYKINLTAQQTINTAIRN